MKSVERRSSDCFGHFFSHGLSHLSSGYRTFGLDATSPPPLCLSLGFPLLYIHSLKNVLHVYIYFKRNVCFSRRPISLQVAMPLLYNAIVERERERYAPFILLAGWARLQDVTPTWPPGQARLRRRLVLSGSRAWENVGRNPPFLMWPPCPF